MIPKKLPQHTELRILSQSDELFIVGWINDSPSHYKSGSLRKGMGGPIAHTSGTLVIVYAVANLPLGTHFPALSAHIEPKSRIVIQEMGNKLKCGNRAMFIIVHQSWQKC